MDEILHRVKNMVPVFYRNAGVLENPKEYLESLKPGFGDILEAEKRLDRFAPLIARLFPETGDGIIESPLLGTPKLQAALHPKLKGDLYLKLDSHLEVAGSIKARGGIYAVLKLTEDLLLKEGLLKVEDDYTEIMHGAAKQFIAGQKLTVASTGNLGLGVGIMGAKLGYPVTVHMSRDAKQWKKDRLAGNGVGIVEHSGDFTFAAKTAREEAACDNATHFIDDEKSIDLFLGYSVAAVRMARELEKMNLAPTADMPLHLYLPCGVGGAPGGITFGFKHIYGEKVKCYFAEPVSAPSMLLGVMTGGHGDVNVNNYGLDNNTELDGLAVASPSDFVSPIMEKLCDGFYTVRDEEMFKCLYMTNKFESIRIEPSAAAGIPGPEATGNLESPGMHVAWTTGGMLVPDDIYDKMYLRGKKTYENTGN